MQKINFTAKDKKINEELYHYFLQHGSEDGWGDKDKLGNFEKIIEVVKYTKYPLINSTVLDVGCGTGDMYNFLLNKKLKSYLGLDIVKLSIQLARLKYKKGKFKTSNFLTFNSKEQYDYIFSSGAISAVLNSDNYKIMELFIQKMWSLSSKGVVFNCLLQKNSKDIDSILFLYDHKKVLSICENVTSSKSKVKYVINRAGDLNEFIQGHYYLIR